MPSAFPPAMPSLTISPPILNSANPWCTTLTQLQALYACPHTGAITTRTALLSPNGFPHDPSTHQFTFYNPNTLTSSSPNTDLAGDDSTTGSLNTLGYSPLPLSTYLGFVTSLNEAFCSPGNNNNNSSSSSSKPIILSVTGSAAEAAQCYRLICAHAATVAMPLAMELNLSCPNIPGKPPPAYERAALKEYLVALKREKQKEKESGGSGVPIGIKTPPYTYTDQFESLMGALLDSTQPTTTTTYPDTDDHEKEDTTCPVSFITAVNTLGSSLLLLSSGDHATAAASFAPSLRSASGSGIGGLAGAPLHPLALGNVRTIAHMLAQHQALSGIQVIGVGGVSDKEGYARMRAVGASAVGVGTALGRKGVGVFEEIGAARVEEENRIRKAVL